MQKTLLIIDDDCDVNGFLASGLEFKGYRVFSAFDGREGLKMASEVRPDLIILDVMMPEMDGWQCCKRLREQFDTPIVILTAIGREGVVQGLELGADDYIEKPFCFQELEMRIAAILRRVKRSPISEPQPTFYDDGRLKIDLDRQRVFLFGQPIYLTPAEFRLLRCLFLNQGCSVSHEDLIKTVWGSDLSDSGTAVEPNRTPPLSLYVGHLQKKLEQDPANPQYIRAESGVGYRFQPAATQA
jgi:DNA-binding response OmpR family regulator